MSSLSRLQSLLPANCNECWMLQAERSVAWGSSTVVWRSYYMPIFTGLTSLSASSTNSAWRCVDAKTALSAESDSTLDTSLWDCIMTASLFAASHQLTVLPHRRVTYGGRVFAVAGPSTCNSLPKRLCKHSNSASVFGRLLKTFFFSEY